VTTTVCYIASKPLVIYSTRQLLCLRFLLSIVSVAARDYCAFPLHCSVSNYGDPSNIKSEDVASCLALSQRKFADASPSGLPLFVRPSVLTCAAAREPLNGFSLNFALGTFAKTCERSGPVCPYMSHSDLFLGVGDLRPLPWKLAQ
jgi:hypothetical protein